MAVIVKNRRGKDVMLLNPREKGSKMFDELTNGVHLTNDGHIKFDKNGKPRRLSDTQKAYRSGFLAAQRESRKAFRATHPDYKSKKI